MKAHTHAAGHMHTQRDDEEEEKEEKEEWRAEG